ncbi:MAG: glycosyltransferase family 4 protein, partial [Planctomycetaceae bacterium]|nr:glycosyltransferase family 4 protein [Planctomycetaceae bacterium]
YLGSVDRADKLRMFSEMDVLCVPTDYHEPKGLYALEAMACGIPVVQPTHGVFPELLDDLGGGLLYQPDNPQDLVQQLRKLVLDQELRVALGTTGRNSVLSRRNGKAMAESTIAVVKQVLSDRQS